MTLPLTIKLFGKEADELGQHLDLNATVNFYTIDGRPVAEVSFTEPIRTAKMQPRSIGHPILGIQQRNKI